MNTTKVYQKNFMILFNTFVVKILYYEYGKKLFITKLYLILMEKLSAIKTKYLDFWNFYASLREILWVNLILQIS